MDEYIRARSDIYFTGPDGSLRSNRAFCQTAGLYACDMFIGSTLQIDLAGNSSTATTGRIAGFAMTSTAATAAASAERTELASGSSTWAPARAMLHARSRHSDCLPDPGSRPGHRVSLSAR
mgnify:CR=1 FL=1